MIINGRIIHRLMVIIPLGGLASGLAASMLGRSDLAVQIWAITTIPVVIGLAVSIVRDLVSGRMGVDAVAFLSMVVAVCLGETLAGVIVAIMYAGGNLLEDFAIGRAERDLRSLVDRAPRIAHRRVKEALEDVSVEQVVIGDTLVVRAGEVVPVDGQVATESALLDESALSGEPIPVMRRSGDALRSGAINSGEAFEMLATATAGDSTYSGIVRMVTAAQTAKTPFMRMADRYALLLLPFTLVVAGAAWALSGDPVRALAVLVAATPCPLILAAPAAFIAGTSLAARRGILIKGGGPLEALASIHTVMFDKTGTLTVGGARLVAVETAPGTDPDEALRVAASVEQASHHVLAAAVVSTALTRGLSLQIPSDVREVLGSGLEGTVDGRRVAVGSLDFVNGDGPVEAWARRAARRAYWRSALTVFVSIESRIIAVMLFGDELRRETPRAIAALRNAGVSRIVMVTGDRAESAETIAAAIDLDAVLADRAPSDKVDAVAAERREKPTLMVGDGINDAPALAAATVGVAMGARGASASSEAADVVILVDRLDRVSEALTIARRTKAIALQSIVAGMGLSGLAMTAAAFGLVSPIAGALIQEAIDVAVILNALRALRPAGAFVSSKISETASKLLREDHQQLEQRLDRLRQIADGLDDYVGTDAADHIREADQLVGQIVDHEREDEEAIYPRISKVLGDSHGLDAMSRAHREIVHQGRLLARLASSLESAEIDRSVIRDAQRMIESIETLVRMHIAEEEDVYDHASTYSTGGARNDSTRRSGAITSSRAEQIFDGSQRQVWQRKLFVVLVPASLATGAAIYLATVYGRSTGVDRGRQEVTAPAFPIEVPGFISAYDAKVVASPISGTVREVLCGLGAKVHAGQVCVKLDPLEFQNRLMAAQGLLAAEEAELIRVKSSLTRTRLQYEQTLATTKRRKDRKGRLRELKSQVETLEAGQLGQERAVAEAKRSVLKAQNDLSLVEITAPFDGVVVSINAEIGRKMTGLDQSGVFSVATDIGTVNVRMRVQQADVGKFRFGEKLAFSLARSSKEEFLGEAIEIAREAQDGPGREFYKVDASVLNAASLLIPGTTEVFRIRGYNRALERP